MTEGEQHGGWGSPPFTISRSELLRGGVLALAIIVALSTQLLFQLDLYQNWPVREILLGWLDELVDQLTIGACVFVCVAIACALPLRTSTRRHVAVLIMITVGAVVGEAIVLVRLPLAPDVSVPAVVVARVVRWIVIAGFAYPFFVYQRRAAIAAAQLHVHELQRMQVSRQLTEAQLQALQAQIEPHFLFNTLATLQRLYRTDPKRGRRMLGSFVAYLRAALPQLHAHETTLRQEVDLARAYLEVLQVRMGGRLRVRFDVPPGLAALPFPPLTVSTLTENAIKHGLNPMPEGGAIEITARVREGRLEVGVADTGAGLRGTGGAGCGLANLRARLDALYGSRAGLQLEANVPRGIRATIAVPMPP